MWEAISIFNLLANGLTFGGQDSSRKQTVFFFTIDTRDGNHKDPEHIDFSVPRRARYVHSAWKRHQDAVYWVDIDLAIREGVFHQTKSNAIILQRTLQAHYIFKLERLRSLVRKTILVSSTTTKDLIETRSQLDQKE